MQRSFSDFNTGDRYDEKKPELYKTYFVSGCCLKVVGNDSKIYLGVASDSLYPCYNFFVETN